jgi:hypothetical protein
LAFGQAGEKNYWRDLPQYSIENYLQLSSQTCLM